MKEGILLYFSEEEFAVMMELAGGNEYSLFLTEPELDDRRLSEAFIRLFQRGLIVRNAQSVELSDAGMFFRRIRNAHHSVLFRAAYPEQRTYMIYVQEKQLWIAEIQTGSPYERYRLRMMSPGEMEKWLIDTRNLPQPILMEQDTPELLNIYGNDLEWKEDENVLVQIRLQKSDGSVLREYFLSSGRVGQILQEKNGDSTSVRIYTQESMREMLRKCFGG